MVVIFITGKIFTGWKEALRLAEIVRDQSISETPSTLDLLAAAYAEHGQFEKAKESAMKGNQLALKSRKHKLAREIYGRYSLYIKNQPYREIDF